MGNHLFFQDPNIPDAKCLNDSDCHQGVAFPTGNGGYNIFVKDNSLYLCRLSGGSFQTLNVLVYVAGVQTGACVNSTQDNTTKTCEIYAWCPVEVDKLPV